MICRFMGSIVVGITTSSPFFAIALASSTSERLEGSLAGLEVAVGLAFAGIASCHFAAVFIFEED